MLHLSASILSKFSACLRLFGVILLGWMLWTANAADIPISIAAPTVESHLPGLLQTPLRTGTGIANGDTIVLTLGAPPQAGYWHHLKVTFGTSVTNPNSGSYPKSFVVYSPDNMLSVTDDGAAFGFTDGPVKKYDFPFEKTAAEFLAQSQSIYFKAGTTGNLTLKLAAKGTSGTWKYTIQAYYRVPSQDEVDAPAITITSNHSYFMAGEALDLDVMPSVTPPAAISRVEVFHNETYVGNALPFGEAGSWRYRIENLGPGIHYVTARVVDDSGRSSYSSPYLFKAEWFYSKISFQPVAQPEGPPQNTDYIKDTGDVFGPKPGPYNSQIHYGWSRSIANPESMKRNGVDADDRFDSYALMRDLGGNRAEWELEVPPGRYLVQLCVGDSTLGGERYNLEIENIKQTVTTSRSVRPGWHEIIKIPVNVSDGKLTIRDLGGGMPPKLNYIIVDQISSDSIYRNGSSADAARGIYPDAISVRALGDQKTFTSTPWHEISEYDTRPMFFYEADGEFSTYEALKDGAHEWTVAGASPVAAYGSAFGTGRIYTGQTYAFDIYAGALKAGISPQFRIRVFNKNGKALVGVLPLSVNDMLNSFSENWTDALRSGLAQNFEDEALGVFVHISRSYDGLGMSNPFWTFRISTKNSQYLYLLESDSVVSANPELSLTRFAMLDANEEYVLAEAAYTPILCMAPDSPPAFASKIRKHAFEGALMPSGYYGVTATEIKNASVAGLHDPQKTVLTMDSAPYNIASITDPASASLAPFKRIGSKLINSSPWNQSASSPELRQHTLLDEFIQKHNSDPIALVNYVYNEIELADAISYNQEYTDGVPSIDAGGVKRGALQVLLEKQGSPAEQCALLVYFLRNCGIPAAYVTTTRNQLLMTDSVVSRMLQVRIDAGVSAPHLVPVNYPWVMALVPNETAPGQYRWVHLFPWIKDIEIAEGLDLYGVIPREYDSGWKWVEKYFHADATVLPFQLRDPDGPGPLPAKITKVYGNPAAPFDQIEADLPREYEDVSGKQDFDQPAVLWPRFMEWKLRQKNLTLDDVGYQARKRSHLHAGWTDFPVPTQVQGDFKALHSLKQVPAIFDIVRYQITRVAADGTDSAVLLDTDPLFLCDVLNRKIYVERYTLGADSAQSVRLTMGAWDPFATAQAARLWPMTDQLASDVNFLSGARIHQTKITDPVPDGLLRVRIVHDHNRGNSALRNLSGYVTSYGGWRLSDAFVSSRYVQNVTVPGVQEVDTNKLSTGVYALCVHVGRVTQDMLLAHLREIWAYERSGPSTLNTDIVHGSKAFLMGMSYWKYISEFSDRISKLHKITIASDYGHLFAGLGLYEREGRPLLPSIDIYRTTTAGYLFSGSLHPARNDYLFPNESNSFDDLMGCQGSAYEHGVIDKYFGSLGAISTMRLFHMAIDRGDELIEITADNYQSILAGMSLHHEAQGRNVNNPPTSLGNLPFFSNQILDLFQTGSLLERRAANVGYMTSKYYEYFDEGGLKLESAGLAPIPALGRMGGLIQNDNRFAHYTYTAGITPSGYGNFSVNGALYSGIGTQKVGEGSDLTLTVQPWLFDVEGNGSKVVSHWTATTQAGTTQLGGGFSKTITFNANNTLTVTQANGTVTTVAIPTSGTGAHHVTFGVVMDDPKLPLPFAQIARVNGTGPYWWYSATISTNIAGATILHRTPDSNGTYSPQWYIRSNPTSMTTYNSYDNKAYAGQYKLEKAGWRQSNIVRVYNASWTEIANP